VWRDIKIRQHLRIFGLIKGMKSDDINNSIEYFIKVLKLEDFVRTNCDKLSGGNKRKLCVATALIGGTTIQFLDEPSSGIDPIARRFLWNAINQSLKAQNSAMMLTTHQMDEAEGLCTRIVIQVNGTLACIGTP
jgi:ATP-binding cassette, subfamily A (ABC1), member 3